MKVICIPDSFKGTMSSKTVCHIMKQEIQRAHPSCEVVSIEVADGGEGTVDAYLAAVGGEKIWCEVQSPYGQPMHSFYGILDETTAVIEMAACAGLPLVKDEKNPELTTTYGVGELILHAARRGCRKIIVGLGGSATNDGGCGAASAIGVRFLDEEGNQFVPTGGSLHRIHHIDLTTIDPIMTGVEVIAMCDIDNPLYGKQGAAYIFGPQKGADQPMVERLDDGLRHLAKMIQIHLHMDVSEIAGGGAAGGMGVGMVAFFRAKLQMGIEAILDTVKFDDLLKSASYVFTGEGKIDSQSLRGKVPIGVARRASKHKVPVIVVVGSVGDDIKSVYDQGVTAVFSINQQPIEYEKAKLIAKSNLAMTMYNISRLLLSDYQNCE